MHDFAKKLCQKFGSLSRKMYFCAIEHQKGAPKKGLRSYLHT